MSTATHAPIGPQLTNKEFVRALLWHRLVNRIVTDLEFQQHFGHEDADMQHELAERILDQTVGFLRLCAAEPDGGYSPSPLVDIGWHAFILYTREYDAFCQSVAGCFIHHCPTDENDTNSEDGVAHTVKALRGRGLITDESLWTGAGTCGGKTCYSHCNQTKVVLSMHPTR